MLRVCVLACLFTAALYPFPAPTRTSEQDADNESISEDSLEALACATVFELRMSYPTPSRYSKATPSRVQPGFLVGKSGLAVTAYDGLRLAEKVDASFEAKGERFSVSYLGGDPQSDLAVIRLASRRSSKSEEKAEPADSGDGPLSRFLSPSHADGVEADDLYTLLRHPKFEQLQVIPLTSVLSASDLESREALTSGPGLKLSHSWSGAVLSGAPIVEQSGTLFGRWDWRRPTEHSTASISGSEAIERIVDEYREKDGERFPNKALGPSDGSAVAGRCVPVLDWRGVKPSGSSARTIRKLPGEILCSECDERGMYDPGGYDLEGGRKVKKPLVECPYCDRTKLKAPDAIFGEVSLVAYQLCPRADADRESALESLEESIESICRVNTADFVYELNKGAVEAMSLQSLRPVRPGCPVAFVIGIGEWSGSPAPGWAGEDVRVIKSETFGHLILLSPRSRRVDTKRQAGLVLGVLAGAVVDASDVKWTVVDRACVVPLEL